MLQRSAAPLVLLLLVMASPAQSAPPSDNEQFSADVASRLLQQVTQGFITNNPGQVLAAFDRVKMRDYSAFRDAIQALFARYDTFRAAYRLRQSWPEVQRGAVIVEFELEGTPLEEGTRPLRRNAQLRFEFERGRQGWRIVAVEPRSFFS